MAVADGGWPYYVANFKNESAIRSTAIGHRYTASPNDIDEIPIYRTLQSFLKWLLKQQSL